MVLTALAALTVSPAVAHKCILQGNSAFDIDRYNRCKLDLKQAGMHDGKNASELQQLREENRVLRLRLDALRRQLLDMAKNL